MGGPPRDRFAGAHSGPGLTSRRRLDRWEPAIPLQLIPIRLLHSMSGVPSEWLGSGMVLSVSPDDDLSRRLRLLMTVRQMSP